MYTDWRRDNYLYAVQQVLEREGLRGGRLGVEDDHITTDLRAKVAAELPGWTLTDVAAATMRYWMGKSPEEIELIKQGARIGDLGGEAVREAIAEGVPEYEVAIAASNAIIREIARTFAHAQLRDTWVWFQSGINTDGAHKLGHEPAAAARGHPVPQLLADDRRLLHGARAHPLLG